MAMSRRKRMFLFAPFALVGLALFIVLGGELVRQLWNWLLPPLFGFREITFWQALGLLVLCRIFFGGHGMRGSGGHGMRPAFERAFRRMESNWDHMTPEERERFRQRMRDRFGVGSPGESTKM